MEKKIYVKPVLAFERFMPNEYIAACITGVDMQCAIPGDSRYYVNDGTRARDNHGICANKVSVNIDLGTGMEISTDPTAPAHPFYSFQLGEKVNGETSEIRGYNNIGTADYSTGWHKARWISKDDASNTYYHYGLVNVTYIDPRHPNHS